MYFDRKKNEMSTVRSLIQRLVRGITSMFVLSLLLLGVTYLVQTTYQLSVPSFQQGLSSLLTAINAPVDANKVGEVAGDFVERISQTDLGSGASSTRTDTVSQSPAPTKQILLKIGLLADIHSDLVNLEKALGVVKSHEVSDIIVLGDLTDFGEVSALQEVKSKLDNSGMVYHSLPGDRDLYKEGYEDRSNYYGIFGVPRVQFQIADVRFLLFDNSSNYLPLSSNDMDWFVSQVPHADFVVFSQPLYIEEDLPAPYSTKYMGALDEHLRSQAMILLDALRSSDKSLVVIAAEHHKSRRTPDPINPLLTHHILGAVTSSTNGLSQNIIQSPRVSILTVYADGTYDMLEENLD